MSHVKSYHVLAGVDSEQVNIRVHCDNGFITYCDSGVLSVHGYMCEKSIKDVTYGCLELVV